MCWNMFLRGDVINWELSKLTGIVRQHDKIFEGTQISMHKL